MGYSSAPLHPYNQFPENEHDKQQSQQMQVRVLGGGKYRNIF